MMGLSHTTEMVTTLAGSSAGLKDGKGSDASFINPWGICMNTHDQCVYICDYNNSIRRLTMEGTSCFNIIPLHILSETISNICSGDVTTFVEKDQVKSPYDIAMNHKANCFYVVSLEAHIITKITSSGM